MGGVGVIKEVIQECWSFVTVGTNGDEIAEIFGGKVFRGPI
jgi:hypothetical protein